MKKKISQKDLDRLRMRELEERMEEVESLVEDGFPDIKSEKGDSLPKKKDWLPMTPLQKPVEKPTDTKDTSPHD